MQKLLTNINKYMPIGIYKHKKGNEHHRWKGEIACYSAIHYWVKRELGEPKECKFCLQKTNLEWCNIDHKYRRVLEDYIPL